MVILVSGGSRGLGLGIVKALLEKGDLVATFSRRRTNDINLLLEKYPSQFYFAEISLEETEKLKDLVNYVETKLGPISALINNAATVHEDLIARQPEDAIIGILDLNLKSTLLLTRIVVRRMMVRNFGRIINVSSIVSISGYKGTVAYSASKGGINAATRALARELGARNITVNAVAPGYMETELTKQMSRKHLDQIVRRTPLKRPGSVNDVVAPIIFLLSDGASFISGQTLVIDGGLSA